MTGLHMASRGGHLLVVARLASLQFLDINKIDTWGYTPLDHAVDAQQWTCAVLLLSMGGVLSNVVHVCLKHNGKCNVYKQCFRTAPLC